MHTNVPGKQRVRNDMCPEFGQMAKTLFKYIQAVHHLQVAKEQQRGNLAPAFVKKVSELDSFFMPAMPTSSLSQLLASNNLEWAKGAATILINHYEEQIRYIRGSFNLFNLERVREAGRVAWSWARRAFGRKLRPSTDREFQLLLKELIQPVVGSVKNLNLQGDRFTVSKIQFPKPGPSKVFQPARSITAIPNHTLVADKQVKQGTSNRQVGTGSPSIPKNQRPKQRERTANHSASGQAGKLKGILKHGKCGTQTSTNLPGDRSFVIPIYTISKNNGIATANTAEKCKASSSKSPLSTGHREQTTNKVVAVNCVDNAPTTHNGRLGSVDYSIASLTYDSDFPQTLSPSSNFASRNDSANDNLTRMNTEVRLAKSSTHGRRCEETETQGKSASPSTSGLRCERQDSQGKLANTSGSGLRRGVAQVSPSNHGRPVSTSPLSSPHSRRCDNNITPGSSTVHDTSTHRNVSPVAGSDRIANSTLPSDSEFTLPIPSVAPIICSTPYLPPHRRVTTPRSLRTSTIEQRPASLVKTSSPGKQYSIRQRLGGITPKVNRGDKSIWKLETENSPTLVLGDSNLARITRCRSDQVEIVSYPGSKFLHLTKMFGSSEQRSGVKNLILNVGINEKANKVLETSFPSFRRMMSAARKAFHDARIFFAPVQWDRSRISEFESRNLEFLNKLITEIKDKQFYILPALRYLNIERNDRFGVHWSEGTANAMLDLWIKHLN